MRTAFINTLCKLAGQDRRIWLVVGDLGFSVVEPFQKQFPDRFINAGVAEQNMTGLAAGLALGGYTVFTYSIANFPTLRCIEQIRNDVCYHAANVKIVAVGGGFTYGAQGYTHHGIEDLAMLRPLPGMTIVAPGDPPETEAATRAIAALHGPCYLRLGKAGEPVVHQQPPDFALGKALWLRRGADVTLISTGGMLQYATQIADRLAARNVQAGVISMHTVKPLDESAVLDAAAGSRLIVTLEEHRVVGGLGSAVAEVLACSDAPKTPLRRVGVADALSHQIGSQEYLRRQCGDVEQIVLQSLGRV